MKQPQSPAIWRLMHQQQEGPLWYWLPGWSFTADVFLPICQQLPGRHLGLDYTALWNLLSSRPGSGSQTPPNFQRALDSLLTQSRDAPGHWVGWSLGGAFARAAASRLEAIEESRLEANEKSPLSLTTLATGNRFLQYNADEPGMAAEVFYAFCRSFDKLPAKTRKRFLALCCQGSDDPRGNMARLASAQIEDGHTELLSTSLQWLTQYHLNNDYPLPERVPSQSILASDDALEPGGLSARTHRQLGQSHALLVEPDNADQLTRQLLSLVNGNAC